MRDHFSSRDVDGSEGVAGGRFRPVCAEPSVHYPCVAITRDAAFFENCGCFDSS